MSPTVALCLLLAIVGGLMIGLSYGVNALNNDLPYSGRWWRIVDRILYLLVGLLRITGAASVALGLLAAAVIPLVGIAFGVTL